MKRCDSCGELKESPGELAISEENEEGGVHICWSCHDTGRTVE